MVKCLVDHISYQLVVLFCACELQAEHSLEAIAIANDIAHLALAPLVEACMPFGDPVLERWVHGGLLALSWVQQAYVRFVDHPDRCAARVLDVFWLWFQHQSGSASHLGFGALRLWRVEDFLPLASMLRGGRQAARVDNGVSTHWDRDILRYRLVGQRRATQSLEPIGRPQCASISVIFWLEIVGYLVLSDIHFLVYSLLFLI